MPIISVRDNKNNRWKKNAKKQQQQQKNPATTTTTTMTEKNKGTEAIVKGWELNNFVVRSS